MYIPAPEGMTFTNGDVITVYQDKAETWQMRKKMKNNIWIVYNTEDRWERDAKPRIEAIFENLEYATEYAESRLGATKVIQYGPFPAGKGYENNYYNIESERLYTSVVGAIEVRDAEMKQAALERLSKEERTLLGFDA